MTTSLEATIEFKRLCTILEDIAKTRDGSKKTHILQTFFDECRSIGNKLKAEHAESDTSLYPILRLILPYLERQRGPHNLKQVSLAKLYTRLFCFAKNGDNYEKLINYREPSSGKFPVGECDFADRAYQVLSERLPRSSTGVTIARVNLFLNEISERSVTMQRKIETFRILFQQITAFEMKWITRILLKNLRLGLGTQMILRTYHPDANDMSAVTNDLHEICNRLHNPRISINCCIQIFSHFKPMLLERLNIQNIGKLFLNNDLYYVQNKYDGERSQLHMKNGQFKYFTRRGYDITRNPGYGDTGFTGFLSEVFVRRLNPNCHSFILDGELMGWHKDKKVFGTKGMKFDVKNLSAKSHHQPCFVAFDIILHNNVLLVDMPYKDRLKLLNDIFTEEEGSLIRCPSTLISNRNELINAFNKCLLNEDEGLVLKRYDMIYKPNIRSGNGCYKIKAEYSDHLVQDVDLIILGGYYGEGKYTGSIKSFIVGVAQSPSVGDNPSQFFSVVSVSTGIGDEMLRDLQTKFASYWVKECPGNIKGPKRGQPDVWIHPKHSVILTIRATEIIRSNEYPIGYSLRFPRVTNIRIDKPWYSACTTSEFLSLVKNEGSIQKLTKRQAVVDDIDEAPSTFKLRKTIKNESTERNAYNKCIIPITRLLYDKEICVINGTDVLTKKQIENILLQHSATVVQNPMNTTFCVIVGNSETLRVKNIVNSGKYDVVTVDWLKRITDQSNWASLHDFLPWELLCSRDSTKYRLAQTYDKYNDSYIIDADEESLKRSLREIEKSFTPQQLTIEQQRKMDEQLFGETASPYSLFRNIIGFFDDQSSCAKFKFRFMSGVIKDNIDSSVTHVFIEDSKVNSNIVSKAYQRPCVKFVNSKWIDDCFQNGKICDITNYVVELH